jgi:hypothetical protein
MMTVDLFEYVHRRYSIALTKPYRSTVSLKLFPTEIETEDYQLTDNQQHSPYLLIVL